MVTAALFFLALVVMPQLLVGLIRKVKARLQNRIGAPVWQPFFDLAKLLRKDETLSTTAGWTLRFAAAFNVAAAVYLAAVMPWFSARPELGNADLFMLLYMLAAMRFLTMLAAMDSGSPFGAFASSREATLSFLVEPAAILSLASLAVVAGSSDLNVVFAFAPQAGHAALWLLSGSAFLLASLVDLSRMPVDDPTTHLELTMVHEALILEASGKNLALFEYGNAVKMTVLFGISSQCFLHIIPGFGTLQPLAQGAASIVSLCGVAIGVGVFESLAVKLAWRRAPEFIAYSLTLVVIASFVALGVKMI
jgi:formate hydrogenlyase subunit 4